MIPLLPRPAPRSRWQRVRAAIFRELKSRPFAYIVLASFTLLGPVVASWIFPEAPTAIGLVGGFVFGAYAALCAVPQKFL